jgi:hypothetical protein
MRHTAPILAVILLGCSDPPDPAEVLVDFAEILADDVYDAIWAVVEGEDGVDLWHLEDGESFSGSASLPSADGQSYGVDGELSVSWALGFELTEYDDGVSNWFWDYDLDLTRLALRDGEVGGQGAWAVEHEQYDYQWQSQVFEGQLAIDGGELQDVSYEAHFSGNLHWVRGSIGEVEVDWENPNPDLP